MGCTVAEAQARTTGREFAEWVAFSRLEPHGEGRVIGLLAVLCAMVANIGSAGKANAKPHDFAPELKPDERDTEKDWSQHFAMMARAAGIRVEEA